MIGWTGGGRDRRGGTEGRGGGGQNDEQGGTHTHGRTLASPAFGIPMLTLTAGGDDREGNIFSGFLTA